MDWRDGQRDGQIKGWRDVVLLYLFYFREKRNFRIFVKNSFSRKTKFLHFRGPFSRKTKMIFVRIFAKIYFRPNSRPGQANVQAAYITRSHLAKFLLAALFARQRRIPQKSSKKAEENNYFR
jgi:hypothetical protein